MSPSPTTEVTKKAGQSLDSGLRAAETMADQSRQRFETAADHLSDKVEGSAQSLQKARDVIMAPKQLIEDARESAMKLMDTKVVRDVRENPTPYVIAGVAIGIMAIAGTFFWMRRRQPPLLRLVSKQLGKWDF